MEIEEKDIKKLSIALLVGTLIVLAFLVIKPVFIAVIGGLILAYVCNPLYQKVLLIIKRKNLAAFISSILVIIIIFVPLWFVLPLILEQTSDLFSYYQSIDTNSIVRTLMPGASERLVSQMTLTINNMISTISLSISKGTVNFILNVPFLLVDLFILAFVFFYALRDSDKLREFARAISPLNEKHETTLVQHFKDMTDSVIYGQIIIGIVQGLTAGIGFALFGVENALILTFLAIVLSIIPFIGPWAVWGPVVIYFFATGQVGYGIAYLLYNLLIVSVIDNVIRSYMISKKTKVSPAIVIVGMIGGVFVFNIIGLILGPLILAYVVTLLESFKDKSIYNLFSNKK